jgi:hypothetical protein
MWVSGISASAVFVIHGCCSAYVAVYRSKLNGFVRCWKRFVAMWEKDAGKVIVGARSLARYVSFVSFAVYSGCFPVSRKYMINPQLQISTPALYRCA